MKYFISLILICSSFFVSSQTIEDALSTETKFYNAVDKWVAFPSQKNDSTAVYGFIYIDEHAGFTFRMIGDFKIVDGDFKNIPNDIYKTTIFASRLSKNSRLFALLNEEQQNQLNLPVTPDWLSVYKLQAGDVSYLTNIGNKYNAVGASQNALEPLLKAYAIEPHFEGLEFELGYAYNALFQFEKSIPILEKAIKYDTSNELLYKELGFAFLNLEDIEKAKDVYVKGISIALSENNKIEMAFNLTYGYYKQMDKSNFNLWAKKVREMVKQDSPYIAYLVQMEKQWPE